MTLVRKAGLAVIALSVLMWMGCDQTYRPVANPILLPGGDPGPTKGALVVDNNGGGIGATDIINVGGDTNIGTLVVGTSPVHAAILPGNSRAYVANQGDDTVAVSLTFLPSGGATFISLPAGSQPVYLNSTQSNLMFAAESGTGKVAALSAASNTVSAEASVGGTPVALAETANQSHLYVAVSSSGNVVDLNPADFTVPPVTIPVGGSPVFVAASSDSSLVFAVNQGGYVSVIATATDTVVQTIAVGASPTFAKYDPKLKRVYVANTGGNSVSVIDASVAPPSIPAPVTVPVGSAPTSVTALADGSRAYVANSGSGTVSVINAGSLTVTKTIPVGTMPLSLDSSSDSKRVVVANRDTVNSGSAIIGSISDIATATDTVVTTLIPGRSNPRFVVITP